MRTPGPGKVSVGHPVDVASGILFQEVVDRIVPGRLPLVFSRRYSSALVARQAGLFGPGWFSPFEMTLRADLDGFRLTTAEGDSEVTFEASEDEVLRGEGVRNLGAFHELRLDRGRWVVTRWDPESLEVARYVFARESLSGACPLVAVENSEGQGVEVTRDAAGRVRSLTQRREKRTLQLDYTKEGRVGEVSFFVGKNPGGVERSRERGGTGSIVLRYKYDRGGRLTEVTDALGNRTSYDYDDSDRLIREVDLGGMVYWFRYDAEGRCRETTGADDYGLTCLRFDSVARTTAVSNSLGHTTAYHWNSSGQVERVVSPLGHVTTTAFDEFGRVSKVIRPSGAVTSYAYDERGNRAKTVSPGGLVEQLEFDEGHRVVRASSPGGPGREWEYDLSGRLSRIRDAAGMETTFEYSWRGDLAKISQGEKNSRRLEWDESGNLARATDWLGVAHSYEYDEQGRVTASLDAGGNRTEIRLDAMGRPREVRLPDGGRRQYAFDAVGALRESIDPRGAVTRLHYTACGQLRQLDRSNGGRVAFGWCPATGKLLWIRNELGKEHRYSYDADGRLVAQTDFAGRTSTYELDADGQVTAVRNGAGQRAEFTYTPAGQLSAVQHDDGTGVKYEYDPRGFVTRADNGECVVERLYDDAGRLVLEKQGEHEVHNDYDWVGARVSRRTSLGGVSAFEWDANGFIRKLQSGTAAAIHFDYDQNFQEIARYVKGGAHLSQDFDNRGRCVKQRVSLPARSWVIGSNQLIARGYGYDPAGNLTELDDAYWGPSHYEYDPAGRLAAASYPGGLEERFAYDLAENLAEHRLQTTSQDRTEEWDQHEDTPRSHGPGNELLLLDGTRYDYDELGRMVCKSDASGTTSFRWDRFGQVREVTLPDGSRWKYAYDPFGRRVQKSGPGQQTEFVWDGDVIVHELHTNAAGEARQVDWEYHPRGYAPLARVEAGQTLLCVNDPLGTPRELVAEDGKVAWSAHLSAYGKVRTSRSDADVCPVRFQGQWFDAETGLHYNRLRYYDPQAGRYLSPDPIGLLGGLNSYRYTHCPVNWIDPLGLEETLPLDGWRYSQTTAGGRDGVRYDQIQPSMAQHGWLPGSAPVDVIRLPPEHGGHLVGFDNTRPLVAQELGWHEIPVTTHDFHEPLNRAQITPGDEKWFAKMRKQGHQLSDPPTWGELLRVRTSENKLPLEGTTDRPRVVRCPKK